MAQARSATLLGGGGDLTTVRMFVPKRWRQAGFVLGSCTLPLLTGLIYVYLFIKGDSSRWLFAALYLLLIFRNVGSFRRLGYVTTDDQGIALISVSGSRSVLWHEISSARLVECEAWDSVVGGSEGYPRLVLQTTEQIVANLAGMAREDQQELLALVVGKAGLSSTCNGGFYRRGPAPALSAGVTDWLKPRRHPDGSSHQVERELPVSDASTGASPTGTA